MMGMIVLPLLALPNCKWPHPSPPLFSVCLIDKTAGSASPEGSGTPTKPPSPGLCLQEGAEQECSENGRQHKMLGTCPVLSVKGDFQFP